MVIGMIKANQNIQEWAVENEPSKEMIYYRGYWDQILFVRDVLSNILYDIKTANDFDIVRNRITVISTHTSKSIKLPVFKLEVPEYNLTIVMRYNFYDWKISILCDDEITCDFMNLFDENETISHLYCEGFPKEFVLPSFSDNNKKFTVEIRNNYHLHTFFWILKNSFTRGE